VTGDELSVKVNEAAKLATAWDERSPDENTSYYVGKLRELYEKFRPLIERDGLVPVTPDADPEPPRQGELFELF
jgi:hypothetical protein